METKFKKRLESIRIYQLKKIKYREKNFVLGDTRLLFKVSNVSIFLLIFLIFYFLFSLIFGVLLTIESKKYSYGIGVLVAELAILLIISDFGKMPKRIDLIDDIYIIDVKNTIAGSGSIKITFYQVNIRYNDSEFYNICTEEHHENARKNGEIIANYLNRPLHEYIDE